MLRTRRVHVVPIPTVVPVAILLWSAVLIRLYRFLVPTTSKQAYRSDNNKFMHFIFQRTGSYLTSWGLGKKRYLKMHDTTFTGPITNYGTPWLSSLYDRIILYLILHDHELCRTVERSLFPLFLKRSNLRLDVSMLGGTPCAASVPRCRSIFDDAGGRERGMGE